MITVYSKPNCPHCVAAKAYLDRHGLDYEIVDVTQSEDALRFIKEERGHKTVPQLYVGKTLLVEGGNATLQTMDPDAVRARVSEIVMAGL